MILSGGYATQYKMAEVRVRAEHAARAINKMMAETDATSVVVYGNSGVSCGFAALMLSPHADFNIVLLRKDNDNSHGAPIEGPEGHRLGRYLILDDFVATGTTMNRIRDKITALHQQYGLHENTPECVGVVLYGRYLGEGFKFSDGHTVPVLSRV